MAHMPSFEEIRHDFERGVRTAEQRIEHPFHRHEVPLAQGGDARNIVTQTPAPAPVNLAPAGAVTNGGTMSLTTLEDDVKNDLTQGLDYVEGMVARLKNAAPGIISTAETVSGSTVGKLLQIAAGKILPPGVEEEFLALAGRYFSAFGQPAQAAPAPVQQPAPAQ